MIKRVFFILCSLLCAILLSSCGSFQNYMNQVSNKYDPSEGKTAATQNNLPMPKCDHWCHNGWCSEHCEGDANQNQL